MLCEKCGVKNATTHIRTIVGDVICDKYLCFSCAASEGFKSKELSQILSSMLSGTSAANSDNEPARCACCGSTIADIAKGGKCGCSECYNTFYEQLLPYLKKSQFGQTKHEGKLLEKATHCEITNKQNIEELKLRLKKLVVAEKYEEAAIIRDKIRLLEEEMQ